MYRRCLSLVVIGLSALPAAALEFSDDFQTVATYNSASIISACYYGGPSPKYTVIELLGGALGGFGDIFNEQAVSGGGKLRISNLVLGNPQSPWGGGFGRFEFGVIGWLGLGIGCPGEPAAKQSTINFTNDDVCMYAGYTFNNFQIQFSKLGVSGDQAGAEFGADGGPGVVGVDDDGNGTTDDPHPSDDVASPEYLWTGADGAPGAAGVDDDGINGTDDQGEIGWSGSDDSDDAIGRWGLMAGLNINFGATSGMFVDIDPQRDIFGQFTIREMYLAEGGFPPTPPDGLEAEFYDPFIDYNFIFCASGTVYGAVMWVEADMASPSAVIGPLVNSRHSEPGASQAELGAFNINTGSHAMLTNATYQGNCNFSNTFWIIEGDQLANYPSPSADLDNDRDVDGQDFLTFSVCYNSSLRPPQPTCENHDADLDSDGDVDGQDFLTFSTCYNGALKRPRLACLPPDLSDLLDPTRPANDVCSGATVIQEGVPIIDNITPNVTRSLEPSCGTSASIHYGSDLWYKYTPTCTGVATLSTCDTTDLTGVIPDNIIAVYNSCGGPELVCQNANNCGNLEELQIDVTASVTYYIQVAGENINDFGKYRLTVSCDEPPNNDLCSGATVITDGDTDDAITLATSASMTHSCTFVDFPDLWYEYTPTCATPGTATISLCNTDLRASPAEQIGLAVYDACSGTQLACSKSDECNGTPNEDQDRAEVTVANVSSSDTLYIAVVSYAPGPPSALTGEFRLSVSCSP